MNLPISPSIAIDSNNHEHVFWFQACYDECMYWLGDSTYYKTRDDGAWVDRSALLQGRDGPDTDIAIDWHGEPACVWADYVDEAHDVVGVFYLPSSDAPEARSLSANLRAYPNPFRSEIAILLDLGPIPRSAVDVLDVSGRLIARLSPPTRGTGPGIVHWNGRDDQGRPAPAGIYMLRALFPDGWRTLRIVRIE